MAYYVHKYETSLAYGGPEEGGWWYDLLTPCDDSTDDTQGPFAFEESAYVIARQCNDREHRRRKAEGLRDYTSVLADGPYYTFQVNDSPEPDEPRRPRYE